MERVLAAGLGVALALAACSPAPTPSPLPPVASPTPDPRLAVLDDRAASWEDHEPPTYAYTVTHATPGDPSAAYGYRVTSLEGRAEAQHVSGIVPDLAGVESITIDGLLETAGKAIAGSGEVAWTFDPLRGYPMELAYTGADGAWTDAVTDFTTPADRGSPTRAREAMTEALARWSDRVAKAYEVTWSRYPAADGPSAAVTWRVRHEGGKTTVVALGGGGDTLPSEDATIERTIASAAGVLAAGGWVDLAVDTGPDPGLLLAVDPSPSVNGDAYWIRMTSRDVAVEPAEDTAEADLAAAKARWAAAKTGRYTYTWKYRGEGGPLTYKVTRKGGKTKIKRGSGTPGATARAYATPRVEDTFAMLEAVLAQGGKVKARYDPKLGYPVRAEMFPAGEAGARGVVTIKGFKKR